VKDTVPPPLINDGGVTEIWSGSTVYGTVADSDVPGTVAVTFADPGVVDAATVAVKPPWPLVVTVTGVPPAFTVTVALAGKLLPVTVSVPPILIDVGLTEICGVLTVPVTVAERLGF
jgi:hypothetical protein